MQFVVIRLGKDSVSDIEKLNGVGANTNVPFSFDFECSQVEAGIEPGNYVVIWLGSDNNKGQPTTWKQGIRAVGKISELVRGAEFNDISTISIEILCVFSESIDQFDFLEKSASHFKYFSKYPVVGIRSSRNNAIQKVHEGERQSSSALLTATSILFPETRATLQKTAAELIPLLNFVPVGEIVSSTTEPSEIPDDDSIWEWITHEIYKRGERNFLFLGAPGTGKSWFAHEIAKKLTENNSDRHSLVQFHPSFSYDDFVEGYTPKPNPGSNSISYDLSEKHLLELCNRAKADGGSLYVIVIDELTRGDPSRVFGEFLTYIEVEHRNKEFSLAYSGKKTFVPDNIVVIATANPYDRSVGELDDALVRRFSMREFKPDVSALKNHFEKIGTPDDLSSRLSHVFTLLNSRVPNGFGHSHFWNLRSESDFSNLWHSRLLFLLKRSFAFEESTLEALVQDILEICPFLTSETSEDDHITTAEAGEETQ